MTTCIDWICMCETIVRTHEVRRCGIETQDPIHRNLCKAGAIVHATEKTSLTRETHSTNRKSVEWEQIAGWVLATSGASMP